MAPAQSTATAAPPSAEELIGRAEGLVGTLADAADRGEQDRRVPEDVVAALAAAGLLRLRHPIRHGGYESSSRTLAAVLAVLARGDGSTAWTVNAWAMSGWIAALFPDHVQDEVFASPDALLCAALSPTAQGAPTDGGLVVDGAWTFVSGAAYSDWQVVLAMAPSPEGSPWPVFALVPMADLRVVDDWYTSGLAATGSVTTVAEGVFVPQDRVLPLPMALAGQPASELSAASPVYRVPLVPTGCATFPGVAVGLAQAALEQFLDRLPGRKITYSDYEEQRTAPITHLQVAEASLLAEEARFHGDQVSGTVDAKGAAGEEWSVAERVRARVSLGRSFALARDAVDLLATASGGSSIYRSVPIQRIRRDVHALNQHALMHPVTNYELHGRILCGLGPNSSYL